MHYRSVEAYVEALRHDPALAMIPLGLVAELKGISRSAVAEQIRSGKLEGVCVRGRRKTWRGVAPKALFAQAERQEEDARERRLKVVKALSRAAVTGQTVPYGEIMAPAGMAASNPRHRAEIGTLLSELSRESLERHGFLIAAIVVQKTTGRPNALFFKVAEDLGCLEAGADPIAFWRAECDKVFAAFRARPKEEAAE